MPLCWSARTVFKRNFIIPEETEFIVDLDATFSPFYKFDKYSDEELVKCLSDLKKPDKMAKMTVAPGQLQVQIAPVHAEELALLRKSESLININEFPTNSIDNFGSFMHQLYIYPLSLNLNAVTGKIRARNILCRVFLRAEDDIDASRK